MAMRDDLFSAHEQHAVAHGEANAAASLSPYAEKKRAAQKPRIGKCKVCRAKFEKRSMTHVCCCPDHAIEHVRRQREKAVAEKVKEERKRDRARKEKLKSRSDWIRETQAAVNRFRRLEELAKGRGCISCGRTQAEVQCTDGWKPGGAWDGGHFIGVGASPATRFEPRMIWLQCKSCNAGSGKYAKKAATVAKAFRENLIDLEGLELVEWLEGPHEPKHYTIDDLKRIRDEYKLKTKELKNAEEQ